MIPRNDHQGVAVVTLFAMPDKPAGKCKIEWNSNFEAREREKLSLSAFLRTEDIGVHIVHISRLIITYTLE